jgi:hypothetical protein
MKSIIKDLKKKDHSTTETIRKKRGDEFEAKIYKKLFKQYPNTSFKLKKMMIELKKQKKLLKKVMI